MPSRTYPHLPAFGGIAPPRRGVLRIEAMNEALEKFKGIVGASETVLLKVGRRADANKALAGAILQKIFSKLGKKSQFALRADSAVNMEKFLDELFEEGFIKTSGALRLKENILIKLDPAKISVNELKYERDGKLLKIILKSEQNSADLSHISVEKEAVPADLLILIDPEESEIPDILKTNPHKEVVKIGTKEKNLGLKILEIARAFYPTIPDDIRDALWFLLAEENKTSPFPDPNYLKAFSELLDLKPNETKLRRAREILLGKGFYNLLGRALVRSHQEKETWTFWSFLPFSDFVKTGQTPEIATNILQELRAQVENATLFYALLYEESPKNISALVASQDAPRLKALAGLLATEPASSYFFANGFAAFSEAELKLKNLIRRVL